MDNNKIILSVVVVATIVNGLLAGGNFDRSLVAMPAWHHAGALGWANFSRYADLGNGMFIYPVMAISGTVLSILAAIMYLRINRPLFSNAAILVLLAALVMLLSLPLSFKAAPFMLSLHHIKDDDIASLREAFSGFERWGRLQGIFHITAFCLNILSIVALCQMKKR